MIHTKIHLISLVYPLPIIALVQNLGLKHHLFHFCSVLHPRWKTSTEVEVNTAFPGLPVEYSTDEGRTWKEVVGNLHFPKASQPVQLRTRSPSEDRIELYSRVVVLQPKA